MIVGDGDTVPPGGDQLGVAGRACAGWASASGWAAGAGCGGGCRGGSRRPPRARPGTRPAGAAASVSTSIALGPQRARRGAADRLGDQRLRVQPAGVEVLGETEDVDDVQVEADRRGDRADEDAFAERPTRGSRALQLGGEHVQQRGQTRRVRVRTRRATPTDAGPARRRGPRCVPRVAGCSSSSGLPNSAWKAASAPRLSSSQVRSVSGRGLRPEPERELAKAARPSATFVSIAASRDSDGSSVPRSSIGAAPLALGVLAAAGGPSPSPLTTPASREIRSQRLTGAAPPSATRDPAPPTAPRTGPRGAGRG